MHLPGLFEEIRGMRERGISVDGRLLISDRAHLLFDLQMEVRVCGAEGLGVLGGVGTCAAGRALTMSAGWQAG